MSQPAGNRSTHREISPASAAADPVVKAALRVLSECRGFITGLDGETYSAPSRLLVGGTIGKHLRHTLDHFAAVTPALEGQTICYDNRTRDVPMETEPGAGLAEIHRLRELLGEISGPGLAVTVSVRILCSAEGEEAEVASTLGRELAFATHHAIHHQAMMKAIAIEHGLTFAGDSHSKSHVGSGSGGTSGPAVSATFGVAPSTAQHAASLDDRDTPKQPTIVKRPATFPTPRPGQG